MSEVIIKMLFNTATMLGTAAIGMYGMLQYGVNYNDRKLKEAAAIAKENSLGETALAKVLDAQAVVSKDIIALYKEINTLKDDMHKEKKDLQERLEKLRDHFEEMTREYFKILSNK